MNKLDIITLSIKSIYVEWSESNLIEDETNHTMQEFVKACENAATDAPTNGGYDKTKFTVTWNDGSQNTYRIDITPSEYNPAEVIAYYIN